MSKVSKAAGQRRRIKRRKATANEIRRVERKTPDAASQEVASNLAALALAINTMGVADAISDDPTSQIFTLRCTLAAMADALGMDSDTFVWYATLGVTMVDPAEEIEEVNTDGDDRPWDNGAPKLESCLPYPAELLAGLEDGSLVLWYSFSRRYVCRKDCRPAIKGAKAYSAESAMEKAGAILSPPEPELELEPEPETQVFSDAAETPLGKLLAEAGYDFSKSVDENLKPIGTVLRTNPEFLRRKLTDAESADIFELYESGERAGLGAWVGARDKDVYTYCKRLQRDDWTGDTTCQVLNPNSIVFADVKALLDPPKSPTPERKLTDPFLLMLVAAATAALASGEITAADLGL